MTRINYKDSETAKTLIREFNENAKIQNNLNHRVHNLHRDLNRCIQNVFKDMKLHFHYGNSKTVIIGIPRNKNLSDDEMRELEKLFNIKYVEYLGEFHHDEGTFNDLLFSIIEV